MLNSRWIFPVLLASATLLGSSAQFAEASEHDLSPPPSGWEFSMTPYLWLAFVTGDMTAGTTRSEDVNTSLFKFIDNTWGEGNELYYFASQQELRKGRLGLFADVAWLKMNLNASGVRNIGGIPGAPGLGARLRANTTITADADVWLDIALVEPGVAFEIMNRSSRGSLKDPDASFSSTAIDVVAGARYWYLKPDIDLNVTATINLPALGLSRTGAGAVSAKKTIDWWDPYIGLRLRQQRGPGKELVLRGDVGGFGVGSDFTWHVNGAYNFQTRILGHDATGMIGYRALYADYSQGSGSRELGFDWLWHGPTMGLKFTW